MCKTCDYILYNTYCARSLLEVKPEKVFIWRNFNVDKTIQCGSLLNANKA
jgi:hypothetical protein